MPGWVPCRSSAADRAGHSRPAGAGGVLAGAAGLGLPARGRSAAGGRARPAGCRLAGAAHSGGRRARVPAGGRAAPVRLAGSADPAAAAPRHHRPGPETLDAQHERVLALGATLLDDSPGTATPRSRCGCTRTRARASVLPLRRFESGRTVAVDYRTLGAAAAPSPNLVPRHDDLRRRDRRARRARAARPVPRGGRHARRHRRRLLAAALGGDHRPLVRRPAGRRHRAGRAGDQGPLPDRPTTRTAPACPPGT